MSEQERVEILPNKAVFSFNDIELTLDYLFPDFNYRPYQRETILQILDLMLVSGKKYIILDSPVGSGKSHIAHKVASVYNELLRKEALILTKSIQLQNQYINDFNDIRMLMGATNYSCHTNNPLPINPKLKHHASCKYVKAAGLCEYNSERIRYRASSIKLLNYAFFFTGIFNYNTNGLLVFDEAHNLEESILEYLSLNINLPNLYLRLKLIDLGFNLLSIFGFESEVELNSVDNLNIDILTKIHDLISEALSKIEHNIENTQNEIDSCEGIPGQDNRMLNLIENQLNPLERAKKSLMKLSFKLLVTIRTGLDEYSIIPPNKDNNSFIIKPIFIPNDIESIIFEDVDKVLLMSGTASRIGQSMKFEEYEVIKVPYTFPIENRPFYALNQLPYLNKKTFELVIKNYVEFIDAIIENYPKETNFIIHSVSYYNASKIKELSKYVKRMIFPTSENLEHILSNIKDGNIIVSPSITEGVDLGNGKAEIQIFLKCPYPYLGDRWVEAKMERDEGWYDYKTLLDIIQGSGRGVRSINDVATTFMLDPSFERLLNKNSSRNLVPEWFLQSLKM